MLNYFWVSLKVKIVDKKRTEMIVKSKLNSVKSIILKAVQEFHISEKSYAFINQEVGWCSKWVKKLEKN